MSEVRELVEELVAEKLRLASALRRIADECGSSVGDLDAFKARSYWAYLFATAALDDGTAPESPGALVAFQEAARELITGVFRP